MAHGATFGRPLVLLRLAATPGGYYFETEHDRLIGEWLEAEGLVRFTLGPLPGQSRWTATDAGRELLGPTVKR
jgi:hypothetical protein